MELIKRFTKYCLTIIFAVVSIEIYSQDTTIDGPSAVVINDVSTYTYDDGLTLSGGWELSYGIGTPVNEYTEGTKHYFVVQWPSSAAQGLVTFHDETFDIIKTLPITITTCGTSFQVQGGGSYCGGETLSVQLTGSEIGLTYQLMFNSNSPIGSPLDGVNGELTWNGLTNEGTYTVIATNGTIGCMLTMASSASIVSGTRPDLYLSTSQQAQPVFSGQSTSIALSSTFSDVSFRWTVASSNVIGATPSTGSNIQQSLSLSNSNANGSVAYSITAQSGGCASDPATQMVNVYPLPVITSSGPYWIQGGNITLSAQTGYDGYVWKNSTGAVVGSTRILTPSGADAYLVTVTIQGISTTASFTLPAQPAGIDMNYIKSNTVLVAGITDIQTVDNLPINQSNQTIVYYDELGRAVQTVQTQASPNQHDIISPVVYDSSGRQVRKYLPVSFESNGRYKENLVDPIGHNYSGTASNFYTNNGTTDIANDSRPFSETVFEPSPLNRTLKQFGPGQDWKANNKAVNYQYITNQASEVYLFAYNGASGLVSLSVNTYYGAGQLRANVISDEHGNNTIEYTDKLSHTVCKKVQYKTDIGGNKLYASTYYIYDDFGNLVVVLPPEVIKSALSTLSQNGQ